MHLGARCKELVGFCYTAEKKQLCILCKINGPNPYHVSVSLAVILTFKEEEKRIVPVPVPRSSTRCGFWIGAIDSLPPVSIR